MIGRLFCYLRGHSINRHRVWHDGQDMRARCRHCGVPMIRTQHDWRPFDMDQDANVDRKPHPRSG